MHKRDLQMEAKAHIAVQERIVKGGLKCWAAVTTEGICEIHRPFFELLPEEFLWAEDPKSKNRVRVRPGNCVSAM